MKSLIAAILTFSIGNTAHAQVELRCEGVGTFTRSQREAEVKVTVKSRENQCWVEIKVGEAVAPRGWRVDCVEGESLTTHLFVPANGDFMLDLGTPSSLEVYYRSGNDFKTSRLDCK